MRKSLLILIGCLITSFHVNAQVTMQVEQLDSTLWPSIAQDIVKNAFFIDSQNRQWVGVGGGKRCSNDYLLSYGLGMKDANGWQRFTKANNQIIGDTVTSIAEDNTGIIWIGTTSGITSYNNGVWASYSTSSFGASDTVKGITYNNGLLWIATANGLLTYNGIATWTVYNTMNTPAFTTNNFYCASKGNASETWIGSDDGYYIYNAGTWQHYNTANSGIESDSVFQMVVTPNRVAFSLSNEGIAILDLSSNSYKTIAEIKQALVIPIDCSLRTEYPYSLVGKSSNNDLCFISINSFIRPMLFRITNSGVFQITDSLIFPTANWPNTSTFINFDNTNNIYITANRDFTKKIYFTSYSNIVWHNLTLNYTHFSGNSQIYSSQNFHIPALAELDINRCHVTTLNTGDLHWDPISQIAEHEVPSGCGINSIYASALWLGGYDQNGLLHTSAQTYRQQGSCDYWPGPLDTISGTADTISALQFHHIWKINRATIDSFIYNYQAGNVGTPLYTIPDVILNWPAHGSGNLTHNLAPFVDVNLDGNYNPLDGDYPLIKGDQMNWCVFNDTLSTHTETNGSAFGFEIHSSAYAYSCPSISAPDEVINFTTFYHYDIINRSSNTYHGVKIGLWSDGDLGNATDDYVGCDTLLNSYFYYNGDNNDDGNGGYGINPPMQNITFLKGPLALIGDGLDNNHNGIIDEPNEWIGLSNFTYYINTNNLPNGYPALPADFYGYMNSNWRDGSSVTFGGNGENPGNGNTGVPTNFMFSGSPYDSTVWNMHNSNILPDDVRGIGSCGPFTIAPGETKSIDFAYIFTRDFNHPNGLNTSVAKNASDVQKIIHWFEIDSFPSCLTTSLPIINKPENDQINIYPNPASDILNVSATFSLVGLNYKIVDATGRTCKTEIMNSDHITITGFSQGLYALEVTRKGKIFYSKFVKE